MIHVSAKLFLMLDLQEKCMGNINSREYWNYRFDRDWIAMQGEEQKEFFARIAMELIPSWFRRRVADDR